MSSEHVEDNNLIRDEWADPQPHHTDFDEGQINNNDGEWSVERTTPPRVYSPSQQPQHDSQHDQPQYSNDEHDRYQQSTNGNDDDVTNHGNIVHVSHMNVKVDDQLLTEHMSQCGKVIKVVIMLDPHTRESRGFGFVTFETPEMATEAIEKLHLSQILDKSITVARARRSKPRDPTPGQYIGPPKSFIPKPRYAPYGSSDRYSSSSGGSYHRSYDRYPPRYDRYYKPYDPYYRYNRYYGDDYRSSRSSYPPVGPPRYRDYPPPPPRDHYYKQYNPSLRPPYTKPLPPRERYNYKPRDFEARHPRDYDYARSSRDYDSRSSRYDKPPPPPRAYESRYPPRDYGPPPSRGGYGGRRY